MSRRLTKKGKTMKKIALAVAALATLAALPAQATNVKAKAPKKPVAAAAAAPAPASDGILVCGLWVVPAHCSTQDRVIGSLIDGTVIGVAAGYAAVWGGASVAGSATVAETVQNSALIGAGVGALGAAAAVATK
jgi:hypothetical protein